MNQDNNSNSFNLVILNDQEPVDLNGSDEQSQSKNKSKKNAIISFVLSLVPLFLILYCFISSGGSGDESEAGAVWWLVIIYYWTIGLPLAIISLICGIKSFKSFKNKLAMSSIIITLFPLILILIALIFL